MPATETETTDLDRRYMEQIRSLEHTAEILEAEYEVARGAASVAKKKLDEAVALLRVTIRRGPDTQMDLQFEAGGLGDTPIEHALNVSAKQLEALRDADVLTVNDFEDLRAGRRKDYPRGLLDVPRIGRATADKWEDEILDWVGAKERESFVGDNDHGDDEEGGAE